ncbi:Csu type fimbrial protein [Citrobacter koseri]|uniref:Csu type fimbrial protein n=1 Tax=Citrobacter koseri TaxID=545 RepID=UPI001F308ED0|nr:spore coat U domain-containing protein [Citrobacter koseri]
MKMKYQLTVLLPVYAALLSHAHADSTSFAVRLTITPTCTISAVPADDVDFGSHSSASGSLTAQGGLTANCTNGTDYEITLDNGSHFNAGSRRMAGQDTTNDGEYVPYSLYTDAARNTLWDDNALSGTGTGSNQLIPLYASISSANFKAGNYLDTVTATVTY